MKNTKAGDNMKCVNCPQMADYEESRNHHKQIWEEIYPNKPWDEYNFWEHLWCDKIDCQFFYGSPCGDDEDIFIKPKPKSNKNKSTKISRKQTYQNKLERIYNINHCWYPCIIQKRNDENDKTYMVKNSKSHNSYSRASFYKKYSNKKVRKHNGDISNGNYYRKIFDYWWEIY